MVDYNVAFKETLEYFNGNELAANAFLGKYALRNKDGELLETTPADMHRRLAKEFARIEAKYPNPLTEQEIFEYLDRFAEIIPQGSPMAGIGNPYQLTSLSNCFVIDSPADSYGGICFTDQEEAQIMKRRGGVGFDISTIRPKGMVAANAAQTTDGIGVFMERFSNTCREVAQGGRRGALMLSISCHHPEIETFIEIKKDLKKVTGANISIRFSDEFMKAVEANTDIELRWPVDSANPAVVKKANAKKIWDKFVEAAWTSAEPGALFWDTTIKRTPADAYASVGFASKSTNPCGELVLSPGDSCRLLLVNVMGFVNDPFRKTASFDWKRFQKTCFVAQRLMDDMVDLELEAIDAIIAKVSTDPESDQVKRIELDLWNKIRTACYSGRRTGLGLTAVGDVMAAMGMRYGSEDAVRFTEFMYRTLAVSSYKSSVSMAKERGPFPTFSHTLEKDHEFIQQIMSADPDLKADYLTYGRRNIANTTTPPAGTTSLLACLNKEKNLYGTTSGIEPAYLVSYKRRKKINPNDQSAKVDFVDPMGDKWQEFTVYHSGYKLWMDVMGLSDENTDPVMSPYWQATSADVDWMSSVDMQAAAQKWICHSISKTCNLPKNTTKELVSDVYLRAWKTGCKGFTIYRDGSRTGVLVSNEDDGNAKQKKNPFNQHHAPKRPKELVCDIYQCTVQGEKWALFVGLLDGKPYEVMGGLAKYVKIPKRVVKGKLVKHNGIIVPARYDLHYDYENPEDETTIQDVGNVFENPTHSGFTRMVSLSLRHGTPVHFVVEQLVKGGDKESDLFSITKAFTRVLKNYIKDGTITSGAKKCPECNSEKMAYKDGCVQCLDCGYSRCS